MDVMERRGDPAPDDARAIDDAWRTHAPAVLRFATALVGPADAHDVVTTVFLRMIARPDWRQIEHVDRYWTRGVSNEAKNLYRQRRRRWQRDLMAVRPDSATDDAPDIDLWRAVAGLSVDQRSVVYLAYWRDMTEAQIADQLGVSRGTVHRTLTRARSTLRKALQ